MQGQSSNILHHLRILSTEYIIKQLRFLHSVNMICLNRLDRNLVLTAQDSRQPLILIFYLILNPRGCDCFLLRFAQTLATVLPLLFFHIYRRSQVQHIFFDKIVPLFIWESHTNSNTHLMFGCWNDNIGYKNLRTSISDYRLIIWSSSSISRKYIPRTGLQTDISYKITS